MTNYTQLLRNKYDFIFEDELIEEILKCGTHQTFAEGDIIIDIDDKLDFMPLLLSGSIKVSREDNHGSELLLYHLEVGDTCAMSLDCCITGTKSAVRATAEEDCVMWMIPVVKMNEWLSTFQSWRSFTLNSYKNRFDELLEAIDLLAFSNMHDRVKKHLKNKVYLSGNRSLTLTHQDIANDLNSSRVVISRMMKKLEDEGVIKQHRNLVEVVNL